jgi:transposase
MGQRSIVSFWEILMSLRPDPMGPVPAETVRVARAAFPKGSLAIRLRDELGPIFDDVRFIDLFATRGRPAEAPWRLALVTILQFAEGLSDRQAAEAVRARIDWKDALGLQLEDSGFDFSVLSEFRTRLVADADAHLLLDAVLGVCMAKGLLKARGRQRTDSTHVLALVRHLSRLETVAETLRAALDAMAGAAPDWLRALSPPEWFERYGRRGEEYRLPKGQAARDAYVRQVGQDGMRLLTAVFAPAAPVAVHSLAAIEILRRVWVQQFVVTDDVIRLRSPHEMPPASQEIESPYEPEARYGAKRETTWVGYKVHLTESCDDDLPHLLTEVQTTIAPAADVEQLASIQDALTRSELLPSEHLVDAGYVRAANLVSSRTEHRINLVGPIYEDRQWQAKARTGFDVAHFSIDWERK